MGFQLGKGWGCVIVGGQQYTFIPNNMTWGGTITAALQGPETVSNELADRLATKWLGKQKGTTPSILTIPKTAARVLTLSRCRTETTLTEQTLTEQPTIAKIWTKL